jgi:alpha-tubulin suppressor-like RCC1 family protein
VPIRVSNLTDVVALAAGGLHSLVLRSDGSLWAWGHNSRGQLGNGTTASSGSKLVQVSMGFVMAVAAGYGHNLALKSDGSLWVWGANEHGQLGDGTLTDRNTSVPLIGLSVKL